MLYTMIAHSIQHTAYCGNVLFSYRGINRVCIVVLECYMPELKHIVTSRTKDLIDSIENLRGESLITSFDVYLWFRNNLEFCCLHMLGFAPNTSHTLGSYNANLTITDTHKQLSIDAPWTYPELDKGFPKLTGLSEFLPGIQVVSKISVQPQEDLRVVIVVDLEMWPSLVLGTLHDYAHRALVNEYSDFTSASYLRQVQVLLDNFYPTIPMSLLTAAAELGLIDDSGEGFAAMIREHIQRASTESVTLPTDLSM